MSRRRYGSSRPTLHHLSVVAATVATTGTAERAGRGLGCAIAAIVGVIVLIVIGGVIWGGVTVFHAYKNASTNTHARSATPSATKPTLQPQTVAGLTGLLTDIRNRFGDTMGYDVYV